MDYVLDDVRALGDVEQVVYITGHLKDKVEAHAPRDVRRHAGRLRGAGGAGRHRGRR
jgi:hypothetical protein